MSAAYRHVLPALILFGALMAGSAENLCGQGVRGTVLSARDHSPIPFASVRLTELLMGAARVGRADSLGFFHLQPPGRANPLEVSAIGYLPYTDTLFVYDQDRLVEVEVEVSLGVYAVPLDPLVVVASKRPIWETTEPRYLWEFFEREEFYTKLGEGWFFDRAALRDRFGQSAPLSLLYYLHPIGFRKARYCSETDAFIDGMKFRGDYARQVPLRIEDLAGVEIYEGPIPVEFTTGLTAPCRVVALWTDRPILPPSEEDKSLGVVAPTMALLGILLAFAVG